MTRVRLWTTLTVLAIGAGMGNVYLRQDTAPAPDRITAESILPASVEQSPAAPENPVGIRPAVVTTVDEEPAMPPPTVALPSGPLLRRATVSPPVDTTSTEPLRPLRSDPALAAPSPALLRPAAAPQPQALDTAENTLAPEAQPSAAPIRRRARSQPRATANNRKVESLFLNPLGVR